MTLFIKEGQTVSLMVQGIPIFLKDQGEGTPTLFLHGNPDTADLWDGVIRNLHGRFRCLAPDLPGFGRSGYPEEFDCSLDNLAQFVEELVEGLGITEPLNLVVHDFGSKFGLPWLVRHPKRVRRLVIMNTVFASDYRWHIWAEIWRTPLVGEFAMLAMNWPMFRRSLRNMSPRLTDDQIRHVYRHITAPMKRMMLRLYRAVDPKDFKGWEDELRAITSRVPTMVLWGDRDSRLPARLADGFGTKHVKHFPDYGHWLPVEASDEVAQEMIRFFSE